MLSSRIEPETYWSQIQSTTITTSLSRSIILFIQIDTNYFVKGFLSSDISNAKNYLNKFNNVDLLKGWVPDVFSLLPELQYSLVHIDVDLYAPTKQSIEYFWDRLLPDGVLICDDFGSSKTVGAKKAMVDFFGRENIIEFSTQQAFVIKRWLNSDNIL